MKKNATVSGNLTVSGTLSVTGAQTFTGATTFSGLIDANGTSATSDNTFADSLTVTGSVDASNGNINGIFRVTGNTGTPSTDAGLEFGYNGGTNVGSLFAYDRDGSSYGDFSIGAGGKVLIGSGTPATTKLAVNGSFCFYADTSSANDSYGFTTNEISAYANGMIITFNAQVANDGACTLQINALGAINIKTTGHDDPAANYIEVDTRVMVVFCDESTDYWMLLSPNANP